MNKLKRFNPEEIIISEKEAKKYMSSFLTITFK